MYTKHRFLFPILSCLLLSACIGDDVIFDTVEERLRLTQAVDTLAVGDSFRLTTLYTNNVGMEEERPLRWASSNTQVLAIDDTGLVTGIMPGSARITATLDRSDQPELSVEHSIVVADTTVQNSDSSVRRGIIRTTSSYVLEGDFRITKEDTELVIDIAENYRASSSLPGLYIYLTNNPNSTQDALEIGAVEVFNGAHTYRVEGDISLQQYDYLLYYCKPFNVKVGDGSIGE